MSAILVTGSNRGIGLELVKRLLSADQSIRVLIAGCRSPDQATELNALAKTTKKLQVIQLDVNDIASFPDVASKVASIVGAQGLNILINNAGIAMGKIHKLQDVTPEQFIETFRTNTVGPIFLTKELLPLIKKAALANKDKPMGYQKAAILNMNSLLGSISHNVGGYWGYRESKAALNQATRSLAVELNPEGILVTALHPGWVKTDMGGPEAHLTVDESTSGLVKVITTLDESKNDKLIQWDGNVLTW